MSSATTPNSSGATDCAAVRRNVLMPSARPHSHGGMMSSRAASMGGFCAVSAAAAKITYGTAVSALCVIRAGMNNSTVRVAATAAAQQRVAQRPDGQHAADRANADEQQQQVRDDLADVVLAADELGAEGLHAGQEVVPAGAGDDQGDVGP